jgi:hypothetical protein
MPILCVDTLSSPDARQLIAGQHIDDPVAVFMLPETARCEPTVPWMLASRPRS